ncbi:hypothetical protein AAFF_G00159960 [Aldrovandia affinis]|uniref:Uncharacterized protein n=1 Tax=Aldrovandia affinis TaxID=143900 RepID=A0AAD7RMZ6_9TELE|nr:hypothetical protein AAFF_G00159960 [Aldrovandia affinis]
MSAHYQPDGTDGESNIVKVKCSDAKPSVLTHGLQHLRHLPCDDPVRHMTHAIGPAAFISLHGGGGVSSYHPDGGIRATLQSPTEFTGLTGTKLPGRIAGWGPGASLALLDSELRPLVHATDPLDIRVCLAAERSPELVTAGVGNVCVWCLAHLVCKMRVLEGLGQDDVFTQLALAPPTSAHQHHRAFAACETAVSLIDLTEGRLLEKRRNLHLREITSLVHYPLLDCLVTASRDVSIRVWGPEGDLLIAFVGHTGLVTALACCPLSGLIISASLDGTLRCWSLEEGDQVQVVLIEGGNPPLALGGPGTGGTFFSFSERGVDFWKMTSLYSLHCKLGVAGGGPMWQITTPPCPPPYPPRALCVRGDRTLALVDAETGAILTAFSLGVGRRVRSADYCLPKETLLVLTEEGAVLRASALTNPATGLDEWQGTWQEPWSKAKQAEGEGDSPPPSPGAASCLVLYSAVTDHAQALEDWRDLQELCGQRAIKRRSLHDAENWFLVMLGQEGGCVSALKWDSGEVLCRAPAHSSQNVTALLADPENSYLFSTGEDRTVSVWKVCPFTPECLSLYLSLSCEHAPVRLASLAPQLALAFQEPDSTTYSLVHLCLETQSRTDHPPSQDHLDSITGLCVCPDMGVLASSSRDGTIRIWDDENRLLRTLQLNAEPECLAYCGQRGGLLLGIRGDLYRIPITQLLPQDLHLQLLCAKQFDPIPDLPITQARTEANTDRSVSSVGDEEQCSQAEKASNTDYAALVVRSRDLETLQQRALESRKKKPSNNRRTKKEAFARYLKLVYRDPLKIELPVEETIDLQGALFSSRRYAELRYAEQAFHSQSQARLLEQRAEVEQEEGSSSVQRTPWGHVPNSVLLEQLWPEMVVENTVPRKPWALREGLGLLSENDGGEVKFLVYDDDDDDDDDDDELNVRHLMEKQDTRPRLTTPLLPLPPPPHHGESHAQIQSPQAPSYCEALETRTPTNAYP